jgi:hypothetical protein
MFWRQIDLNKSTEAPLALISLDRFYLFTSIIDCLAGAINLFLLGQMGGKD